MYKKTFNLDDIHVIHYNKNLKRGYQYNHEYEKRLHEKRLELLKKELLKNNWFYFRISYFFILAWYPYSCIINMQGI